MGQAGLLSRLLSLPRPVRSLFETGIDDNPDLITAPFKTKFIDARGAAPGTRTDGAQKFLYGENAEVFFNDGERSFLTYELLRATRFGHHHHDVRRRALP